MAVGFPFQNYLVISLEAAEWFSCLNELELLYVSEDYMTVLFFFFFPTYGINLLLWGMYIIGDKLYNSIWIIRLGYYLGCICNCWDIILWHFLTENGYERC